MGSEETLLTFQAAVADFLPPDATLLSSELERDEGARTELIVGGTAKVEYHPPRHEPHVLESEWVGLTPGHLD